MHSIKGTDLSTIDLIQTASYICARGMMGTFEAMDFSLLSSVRLNGPVSSPRLQFTQILAVKRLALARNS